MRILLLVHGYPPTRQGGAEQRAARTARALASRGHDVRVVCVESVTAPEPALRWDEQWQDGVLVRRLYFSYRASPTPFRWSFANPLIGSAIAELLATWQPDIAHLFSGYLMSASSVQVVQQAGIPLVVSLTDYWWLCHRINLLRSDGSRCSGPTPTGCARCQAHSFRRHRLAARVLPQTTEMLWRTAQYVKPLGDSLGMQLQAERAAVLRKALAAADALIAPSRYLANQYVRHGANPARMRLWRQGVDLDRCLLPNRAPHIRVGYLGQIKPHKGVHVLLEAWRRLQGQQPRHLVLYGSAGDDTAYGAHIRAMVGEVAGVSWPGTLPDGAIWQALAELDVLVVPSRWVENSPNCILEAQAVGIPVVGSDLGGIAELIDHNQNGLRFAVDNPADLAAQLQRLLDEPGLLARLRQYGAPFKSFEDEINQIEQLYGELSGQTVHTGAQLALEASTIA